MKSSLSLTFTLHTCIIFTLVGFCMQPHSSNALTQHENVRIELANNTSAMYKHISEELAKNTTAVYQLISEEFRQATGYKLSTVLIIAVMLMTIPSILINVIFLACQLALKSGTKVACCCCKHGVKAGMKTIGCCCKMICRPCISCSETGTAERTPLLEKE